MVHGIGMAAVIAAMAITLVAVCGPGDTPERGEVVLSIGYAAPAEAGVATGLDQLIDQLTQEGLFRSGPDGRVEPMLAETWEVNRNGTAVTVVLRPNVAFHDVDGGLSWRRFKMDRAALVDAGMTPTASTRVRFTVGDFAVSSIVEAGVDAFEVYRLECP